ncbi:MAG: hypothetical protein KC586_23075, partial [Myxococcales bacterium]|nr:hypothetical protein [Myxococcales bacterium]
WVQEAVDGMLRASLTIEERGELVLPALDARPFDGCETSNACGEIATPWEVTLADDFGWVQLGPRAFGTTDGTTRVDVMLAQSSVAVDLACVDGVGSLGGRFVVARSERFEAVDPEPTPEPTPDEPAPEPTPDVPPETP